MSARIPTQRADEQTALHGHPTVIETIAADYPHWDISRQRDGAQHGDWEAVRGEATLTANSPAGLLVRLERHEKDRLQDQYSGTYRVWRTERYWMASARVDGITPTLMEETADALEARLANPGRPIAANYKLGNPS